FQDGSHLCIRLGREARPVYYGQMPEDRVTPNHSGAHPVPTFASPQTHPTVDRDNDPPPYLAPHGCAQAPEPLHSHPVLRPISLRRALHGCQRLQYEQTLPVPLRLQQTVQLPDDFLADRKTSLFSVLVRYRREIEPAPHGSQPPLRHSLGETPSQAVALP